MTSSIAGAKGGDSQQTTKQLHTVSDGSGEENHNAAAGKD